MVLPEPLASGGVPGTGRLLALGLAALGHEVDAYTVLDRPERGQLLDAPGLRCVAVATHFGWHRWYSRTRMAAHLSQLLTRSIAGLRLTWRLRRSHRRRPYDVVYRFSTIELMGTGLAGSALPPIVVHPEVHAAGELAAMHRERALVARTESRPQRLAVEALLRFRSWRQRRALARVSAVIAPSRVFADHLVADYGVDASSVHVAPNPVDLGRFQVAGDPGSDAPPRWQFVFVGRISVRKGIDQLVELSHRIEDLARRVELRVIGGASLWSDYRPLLDDLDPAVASATGSLGQDSLAEVLARSDVMIQPSTYEPFAITVAEGLASGLAVIATDEVGAAEELPGTCCTRVPPGDPAALEKAVRAMVDRLDDGEREQIRVAARREAEERFAPDRVTRQVAEVLEAAATRGRQGRRN